MSKITILHLSDIHWRKKVDEKNKTFRQNVQNELIDAVKTHVKKYSNPDFVAVTGDIAYSGKKYEYDEALTLFKKIKTILPSDTKFLAVPGNHDVDRKYINEFLSMHSIVLQGKERQYCSAFRRSIFPLRPPTRFLNPQKRSS